MGDVAPRSHALSAIAGAALLVLTACGTGSDPDPASSPTATTPKATQGTADPTPPAAEPAGTPAPEALSRFRCEKISSGWAATGVVANGGKSAATFRVTVYVGPADGSDRDASTRTLADVAAGGSTEFRLEKIPAEGSTCHVQVLRADG